MPKDLRAAQEVSADASSYTSFPAFFLLTEQAASAHRRVELRVAVKMDGMVQRVLQIDVNASRFSVLDFPQRNVLDSFEISHLIQADFPSDLVIRLMFRHRVPGCMEALMRGESREPVWSRTFHTMSASQRDYIGALLQGLVGLTRPLNAKQQLLCSPVMLKVGREKLNVWTGSWNMSGKPPPEFCPSPNGVLPNVRPWLQLDEAEYDLYAAGVQEMDPSIFALMDQQMGPNYYVVAKVSMGNIALVIYCRKRLLVHVKNVETLVMATGFAGVGTNKGFVACGLTYMEQPLLFINCHLAARDDAKRLRQRIHQYKLAARRLKMGRLPGTDVMHQFTVWFFGDMNFRVCTTDRDAWPQSARTREGVIKDLCSDAHADALQHTLEGDQLGIEKARGTIFDGFREMPIRFSPTYKYKHFSAHAWESVKDARGVIVGHQARDVEPTEFSSKRAKEDLGADAGKVTGYYLTARSGAQRREYTDHKAQAPSWCDRILHRALPSTRVQQHSYQAVDDILTSDHSPVCATFTVDVPMTSQAVPSAAFHVGAIQILRAEVFCLRHPAVPLWKFFESSSAANARNGKTDADGGDEDDDEDEDEPVKKRGAPHASADDNASVGSQDSEPDIYAADEAGKELHFGQLVLAAVFPFMREAATRSRVTSKPAAALSEAHTWKPGCKVQDGDEPEFRFAGKELTGMAVGPFLTTREYLQSQWFVLHLLPKTSSETRESAAACVVSLAEAAEGQTVNFVAPLQHNGQPSGFIRGRFRVWLDSGGWDEEFVAEPGRHPLYPKMLTRFAAGPEPVRRRSPAVPGAHPLNPLPIMLGAETGHVVVDMDDDDDDGGGGDDDDELLRQAAVNAVKNASGTINRFQREVEERKSRV